MTALEASELTCAALKVDKAKVKAVLDCWYEAIRRAANSGRRLTFESAVSVLRTPISDAEREAALEQLRSDGFGVRIAPSALSGTGKTIEVSW